MRTKALKVVAAIILTATSALAADEEYETVHRAGALILAHNGYAGISIGVDTTNPDLLKLAISLQETVFALGGARPPIENIGPSVGAGSTNMMWRMIYFTQDLRNMGEQPLYTVSWEYLQPGYSINCPKRLRIAYHDVANATEAIETILKRELGTGLTNTAPSTGKKRLLYIPTETPASSHDVIVRQIMTKEWKPSNKPSERD